MASGAPKAVTAVVAILGVVLTSAGGAWYYFAVARPLAWPRETARVVSSRVVNPVNPNQYSPEVVLRLEDGVPREVTVTASWSSGSYEMVKRYVDRYPAGLDLEVAVNPTNRNDIRYELGATFSNVLGPMIVGAMGALFAGVAGFLWRRSGSPHSELSRPAARRLFVWVFGSAGAIVLAIGAWLASKDVDMYGVSFDGSAALYRWTPTGTHTGPQGTGKAVHISGFERWTFGADGLIEHSLGHIDDVDYKRQLGE